jgi:oxygen-independent coproporphyrinogen-3 oxidase
LYERYVAHLERELSGVEQLVRGMGAEFDREVDSVYLGGGTPSVLEPAQLRRIFAAVRGDFNVCKNAEITVECAPSTLSPEMIETLVASGVNRVSLGVQSFVDQESRAVGRLHTREITLQEIARLRDAGISEISIDLIAGLPFQTAESWRRSLDDLVATGAPHASVYMLEVDDESRLGRELIAGGTRYHAHHVPDDDLTADLYVQACERLDQAGVRQYEISNFAREGHESRHNLKYWLRDPYLGFGVDAHSMLLSPKDGERHAAVRAQTADELEPLLSGSPRTVTNISESAAIEETYFLGLRLVRGVNLLEIKEEYGVGAVERYRDAICEMERDGLVEIDGEWLRLTPRGRLLSNDVFSRFL